MSTERAEGFWWVLWGTRGDEEDQQWLVMEVSGGVLYMAGLEREIDLDDEDVVEWGGYLGQDGPQPWTEREGSWDDYKYLQGVGRASSVYHDLEKGKAFYLGPCGVRYWLPTLKPEAGQGAQP